MDYAVDCSAHVKWLLRYWGTWMWAGLLIAGSVFIHLKNREEEALTATLLAWQFMVFDSARSIPDMLFGGTVMSHMGPSVAVSMMMADLGFYWLGPGILTVPILAFAWRPRFRSALRENRWSVVATCVGLLNFLVMVAGISRLLLMRIN
jgi:hypothetical protein